MAQIPRVKSRNFFVAALLLCVGVCNAQKIEGQVKDKNTNDFIAFATIGVIGTDIGTISELDGTFSLDVSEATNGDTLRLSFIGYQALNFSIGQIREKGFPNTILLEEKIMELQEVILSANMLTPKAMGVQRKQCYPIPLYKKASSHIPFPQAGYQHEIGSYFANERLVKLDSIELNFNEIKTDEVPLRVNIYEGANGDFKSVLDKPIYIEVRPENESQRIDVSHLGIALEGGFLVTIENYKRVEDRALNILANFKSKGRKYPTYYRKNTHSDWITLTSKSKDFGLSFIAYVRQ